jgi:hypothetical protein
MKKFINIKGIILIDFKRLLEKLCSNELLLNVDDNYNTYVIKDKLEYLQYYKPKNEYFFCDAGVVNMLDVINYKNLI